MLRPRTLERAVRTMYIVCPLSWLVRLDQGDTLAQRMVVDSATQVGLCREHLLVVTLLKQAIMDLDSPHRAIRQEAVDFLRGGEMLEFWTSLVGIDRQAWQEHAQQALQRSGR